MATTFEKRWFPVGNITVPASGGNRVTRTQEVLFLLKQLLIGALNPDPTFPKWTVIGSSDGATRGNDGIDRWTDPSKIVWISNSSQTLNHAWITLQSPSDPDLYLVLGWSYMGSTPNYEYSNFCFAFTRSGVPTAGVPGTNQGFPSWTNGWGNFPINNTAGFGMGSQNVTPHRFHAAVADDGSFVMCLNEVGKGFFNSIFFHNKLADTRPTDLAPYVSYFHNIDGGNSTIGVNDTAVTVLGTGNANRTWMLRGANLTSGASGIPMLLSNPYFWNQAPYSFISKGVSLNDSADPVGTRPDDHIWIADNTVSRRGRLVDIRMGTETMVAGTVEPNAASPTSFACGVLWLPIAIAPDMS